MILVVNICFESLHYFEFVRPVEDILRDIGEEYFVRHYRDIKKGDLMNADKVIICGTSLYDNRFIDDVNYFLWVCDYRGKVLGICGGMQVIGLVYDLMKQAKGLDIKNDFSHILKKKTEIGFYFETFNKEFLGLNKNEEVYHLHNYYIDFKELDCFDIFCESEGVVQAVKHREKKIYGVLFHPEVRNKEVIKCFLGC